MRGEREAARGSGGARGGERARGEKRRAGARRKGGERGEAEYWRHGEGHAAVARAAAPKRALYHWARARGGVPPSPGQGAHETTFDSDRSTSWLARRPRAHPDTAQKAVGSRAIESAISLRSQARPSRYGPVGAGLNHPLPWRGDPPLRNSRSVARRGATSSWRVGPAGRASRFVRSPSVVARFWRRPRGSTGRGSRRQT